MVMVVVMFIGMVLLVIINKVVTVVKVSAVCFSSLIFWFCSLLYLFTFRFYINERKWPHWVTKAKVILTDVFTFLLPGVWGSCQTLTVFMIQVTRAQGDPRSDLSQLTFDDFNTGMEWFWRCWWIDTKLSFRVLKENLKSAPSVQHRNKQLPSLYYQNRRKEEK